MTGGPSSRATDGFAHIDVCSRSTRARSRCPSAARPRSRSRQPTWCSTPAPPAGEGAWERTVRWWRAAPQALCEPWAGASVSSIEHVRALARRGARRAVPHRHRPRHRVGRRHPRAAAVRRARAAPRRAAAARRRSRRATATSTSPRCCAASSELGYDGVLSIEYFDLPEYGWPCADPRAYAIGAPGALLDVPGERPAGSVVAPVIPGRAGRSGR